MQFKIRNTHNTLACLLTSESKVRFTSAVACAYEQDTVIYAACRYIRHCPQLRERLIYEAVRLGLDPRGGKKRFTHRIKAKAAALSLPGDYALITVCVMQGRIVLKSVRLF